MEQSTMNLQQNELQDKYLQARELIIRFLNGDENAGKDALAWIERTNQKTPPVTNHSFTRSSNLRAMELHQDREYPLVVAFKDGSIYAYDARSVTYHLPDKTVETKTAMEIFELICQEDDDPSGSVGHLFHHLIKRSDNKQSPIKYKRI